MKKKWSHRIKQGQWRRYLWRSSGEMANGCANCRRRKSLDRYKNILVMISLLLSPPAPAQVLVRHPQVTPAELKELSSSTSRPHWLAYYQNTFPSPLQKQMLQQAFNRAEDAFVTSSLATAEQLFGQVLTRRFDADWTTREREWITHSFLRWAQLATNAQEQNKRIRQGAQFDPYADPSPNWFPPELLDQLRSEQKRVLKSTVPWTSPTLPDAFEILLVNGRSYDLGKTTAILIPQGPTRLTWLSSALVPQTLLLHEVPSEPPQIPRQPLIMGECYSPQASEYLRHVVPEFSVLFPQECQRGFRRGKWDTELAVEDLESRPLPQGPVALMDLQPPQEVASPKRERKTWLWGALLGVGLWFIYQHNQEAWSSVSPNAEPKFVPSHD